MKFLTEHSIKNSIEEMDTLGLMRIYDYMSGKKYIIPLTEIKNIFQSTVFIAFRIN